MMRKLAVLIAASVIAAVVGAFLVPAASQQAKTIKVYETERSGFEKDINVGGKGFGAGDYFVESHPLYRAKTTKKVGHDVEQLTIIKRLGKQDASFRAAATFNLGAGKIEVAGTSTFALLGQGAAFAVTGGTGAYEGASGTLTVRTSKGRVHFIFALT